MKRATITIVLVAAFFVSLSNKHLNIRCNPIKYNVESADTVVNGFHWTIIFFKIENTSNHTITIRNPAHYGNTYPHIKFNNEDLSMFKVTPSFKNLNDTMQIKQGEILKIPFDHTMEEITGKEMLPIGKYEIKFQIMTKLFISITKETDAIESNTCIFYKK